MKNNPILRVVTKTLFAPIILYGLYVQFHGDFSPGGGFQAGVIMSVAFILYGIVFSLESAKKVFPVPAGPIPKVTVEFCIRSMYLY